ncbi:MAG: tRNA (adenosine(37)-N6)-threonylcarbamoyltransferase complex ATPase subunit type 1 TsaE [Clostridia bacterium]|nr:tRNA (adenosine(37)-N6)-threonylcarbamoyltransferase complex ATPase subunit type 1 TsaE [Clostridia bacterium]
MKLITRSTEETYALAQKIAQELKGGEVILLNGTLGAGKTTFTKGLALALGVKKTVVSPTFTIIKEYEGEKLHLYHIDMYRLEDDDELEELGVEELYREDSVVVIEWNRATILPNKVIKIDIEVIDPTTRKWEVKGI